MVSKIYLLRHGETEWTISGRHTGVSEVPLTTHGEAEARALGKLLDGVSFQRVLSSPRERARRTCDLAGLRAEIVDDLREWNYGEYEGLLTREIRERRPDWKIFDHGCPGGESPQQISERADRVLASVRAMDGNIALFSHGHFTRVLTARWVELPVSGAQILASSTGSMSILGFASGPRPVIQLWNRGPAVD
jgi:probable phosphoglycerate mutase